MKNTKYFAAFIVVKIFAISAANISPCDDLLEEIMAGVVSTADTAHEISESSPDFITEGDLIGKKSLTLPQCLLGREDIYSQSVEIGRTIRKLEKADYIVKNETEKDSIVKLTYLPCKGKDAIKVPVSHNLVVSAGQIVASPVVPDYYVSDVSIDGKDGFLNIYDTTKGFVISVESEPSLVFPRPFSHISFIPHTNRCFLHLAPSIQAKLKKEFYADHNPRKAKLIDTIRVVSSTLDILVKEVGDVMDVFQQRQDLYELNKLEKIIAEIDSLPAIPRIPLNLFSIWFTSSEKPSEPDRQLLEFALTSSKNNPPEEGWTHYFVTNDKKLIPNTVDFLSGSPIKVVELSELGMSGWTLKKEIENAIAEKRMGLASDIARVELLNSLGGAYLDIDFELFQSLKTYFYLYDSLWGEEDWSYFLCNAFMAARPGHPAISEYIKLLKRNFSEKQPIYIKNEKDKQWKTIMQTGPGAESIAAYLGAGKPGYRDIIMPIQAFFPIVRHLAGTYSPRHECHLLESSSMHYYLGTWTGGSKYNSVG